MKLSKFASALCILVTASADIALSNTIIETVRMTPRSGYDIDERDIRKTYTFNCYISYRVADSTNKIMTKEEGIQLEALAYSNRDQDGFSASYKLPAESLTYERIDIRYQPPKSALRRALGAPNTEFLELRFVPRLSRRADVPAVETMFSPLTRRNYRHGEVADINGFGFYLRAGSELTLDCAKEF